MSAGMGSGSQPDQQARQQRSNMRLAWALGMVAMAVFAFVIYYLRAK